MPLGGWNPIEANRRNHFQESADWRTVDPHPAKARVIHGLDPNFRFCTGYCTTMPAGDFSQKPGAAEAVG